MLFFRKLYKSFIIFVFKKYYGDLSIANSKFEKNNLKLRKVCIDKKIYTIYEIDDCRIYSNSLHVAFIKNNKVLKLPSMQSTLCRKQNIKDNVVFTNGTPKFFKKFNCRVFSLLTEVDANNNYFHWFFDSLPKLFIFKKIYKLKKNDFFLVPNLFHDYQIKSLQLLKIKNLIDVKDIKHLKVKKITGVLYNSSKENPENWILKILQKSFKKKKKKVNLKLYVNRTGLSSKYRDVYNKAELIDLLKRKDFHIVDTSKLSFFDEIQLFNSTKIVIGLHGAGLTNLVFCNRGTVVIEFKNEKNCNLFKNISEKIGLNYHSLVCKSVNTGSNRPRDGFYKVNIKSLLCKISEIDNYNYNL